jgi:hypothetical protein
MPGEYHDHFFNNASNSLFIKYNGTVYQLFIDFKKAYDSIRRGVLYNILIDPGN